MLDPAFLDSFPLPWTYSVLIKGEQEIAVIQAANGAQVLRRGMMTSPAHTRGLIRFVCEAVNAHSPKKNNPPPSVFESYLHTLRGGAVLANAEETPGGQNKEE
jgi:hypothetical protein